MHVIVTNAGRLLLLDLVSGVSAGAGLAGAVYHLFDLPATVSPTSVIGDFHEPSAPSLAAITSTGWTAASLGAGDVGETHADPMTWVNLTGSAVNLYGIFVTQAVSGALLFAFSFDSPPQPLLPDQALILNPVFQDNSIFTS